MKTSMMVLFSLALGLILGIERLLPEILLDNSFSKFALYTLLFFVGTGMGSDKENWVLFKKKFKHLILIPGAITAGSISGACIFSIVLKNISLKEAAAVGAGFGYYSLSSVIIAEIHSEYLGIIALLANISREIITLVMTPVFVKYSGKLAGVASGGATAMDTTLPVIVEFSGKEIAAIAIFSGFVLTLITPFAVSFILNF